MLLLLLAICVGMNLLHHSPGIPFTKLSSLVQIQCNLIYSAI